MATFAQKEDWFSSKWKNNSSTQTMPKSSYSKKRKRDNKKHEEREAKKAKSNDNKEVADGKSDHTSGVTERGFDDIDEILEENATRNNLTAINVKSILHVSLM